jgi:hypothetical protein
MTDTCIIASTTTSEKSARYRGVTFTPLISLIEASLSAKISGTLFGQSRCPAMNCSSRGLARSMAATIYSRTTRRMAGP